MTQTVTKRQVHDLAVSLHKAYADQLNAFGPSLKKKTRDILLDGFADGLNTGLRNGLKLAEVNTIDE
jgi:hypothetical protein